MFYAFFHVLGCSPLVILEILEYRKMQNMYPCRILIQNLWSSRRVQGYCCILDGTEAVFKEKRGAWEPMLELTLNLPNLKVVSSLLAKFMVLDWGDKVVSDIGLSYRPASLCSVAGRYDNHMLESTISPVRDYEFGYRLPPLLQCERGGLEKGLFSYLLGSRVQWFGPFFDQMKPSRQDKDEKWNSKPHL